MNWISVITVLILAAALCIIPVYRRNESYFGVRLPEDFYLSRTGKRYFHRWNISIGFFSLLLLAIVFLGPIGRMPMGLFGVLIAVFILAQGILYARSYTRLKERETLEDIRSSRTAASLEVRKLRDFLNPWIELITLLLVLLPAIILTFRYDALPEQFPLRLNWNLYGAAGPMVVKSFRWVFIPTGIALGIYLLFLLISSFIVKSKITLPERNALQYHQLKISQLTLFLRSVDLARLFVITSLGVAALTPVFYQVGQEDKTVVPRNIVNYVLLGLLIAGIVLLLLKNSQINAQLKALAGTVNIAYRNEAQYWKWGIFYINSSDPAIWVERRDGLGYTVNLGQPAGRLILVILLAIPAVILLLTVAILQ